MMAGDELERALFSAKEYLTILRKELRASKDSHEIRKLAKYVSRTRQDIREIEALMGREKYTKISFVNFLCRDCGSKFSAPASNLEKRDIPCSCCGSKTIGIDYHREFVEGGG